MNIFSLVIDTTSKYSDIWPMTFGQIEELFPKEILKRIFVDPIDFNYNIYHKISIYNNQDSYRNQMVQCLNTVEEQFILYTSEDYILYNTVDYTKLLYLIDLMITDPSISFIKLTKGPEQLISNYKDMLFLNIIDTNDRNFYAQQATIWRTNSFRTIFNMSDTNNNRIDQETTSSELCKRIGLMGLQCYNDEPKRGQFHYDSYVYPHIATAITRGKWNISEYKNELLPLLKKYNIDPNIRGIR
jgi:hypothetical protein